MPGQGKCYIFLWFPGSVRVDTQKTGRAVWPKLPNSISGRAGGLYRKQTGQKRSRLRVVGEALQLLGGRPESEETASPLEPDDPDAAGAAPRAQPKDPMFSEEPGDIPF